MLLSTTRSLSLAVVALLSVASAASNACAQNGWFNPEVYNSGRKVTGATYDPFTGRIIVRTDQTKVRESYLDPNRGQIDPGSYRNVNRYETDINGVRWHVTGTQWTSNGTPHGNLSRRRIGGGNSGGGQVIEDRNEHVAFGAVTPKSNNSKNNSNRSSHQTIRQYQSGKPSVRNYSPF